MELQKGGNAVDLIDFFRGKSVLITGHTGFKGAWLSKILILAGAEVTGYALDPPTDPNLFSILGLESKMHSVKGDVRDPLGLANCFNVSGAEIAIHMAAQAIVRSAYAEPRLTFETNVMGTVNFLEAVRASGSVKSVLNVTTDKVYDNREWPWGYRETDRLDGYDPYSNSKSCSELITHCYRRALLADRAIGLSTARAGNVIGGGDFAQDRILADCIRAALKKERILIRNPHAIRPYQHVLEALSAYLVILKAQYENQNYQDVYNVGPEASDLVTNGTLVSLFCEKWGEGLEAYHEKLVGPHEASCLRLDCAKLKSVLGWRPKWDLSIAMDRTIEWSKAYARGEDVEAIMEQQIKVYFEL